MRDPYLGLTPAQRALAHQQFLERVRLLRQMQHQILSLKAQGFRRLRRG
jgi:hypothetical protein